MSQFFEWGSQSIGVSASASVLSMNVQDWSPLGWTSWISLQSKGLSRVSSNTKFKSISSSALSFLYSPTLTSIHDHWKRPWCWERLKAGEGDERGWDGWMASPTQWTWVWVNSGSWWWIVRPGMLQSMGSQRVRHDWVTELNWKT